MALPFNSSSVTQDILTYFETLIDDSLDQDTELELAEAAKNVIEDSRDWEFLKSVDTSQNFNAGDTYLTPKNLPDDFSNPIDSGIYVGKTNNLAYLQLPYQEYIRVQDNIAFRYYIDFANSKYYVTGQPAPDVIYFFYKKYSPVLNVNTPTSQQPLWPARFWPLIAYQMAMDYYPIDQGEKGRAWDDRWQVKYNILMQQMVSWDARNKMNAQQNRFYKQQAGPLVLDF